MTSRSRARTARPVSPELAVPCRVSDGYLIFDQQIGEQVGAGSTVLVHPATVAGWVRNGWVTVVSDASDTEQPQPVPEPPAPAPRRRTRNASAK